ncbi:hypothetical protein Q8G71_36305, partial [Klebsiella pneumoniae]
MAALDLAANDHRRLARLNDEDIREPFVQLGAAGRLTVSELQDIRAIIRQPLASGFARIHL